MTTPSFGTLNLPALLPVLITVGWACVLLLVDLFVERKLVVAWLAVLGLLAALVATILQIGSTQEAFNGMLLVDGFTTFLNIIFLTTALLGVLISTQYLRRTGIERGEYYALMLFTTSGMMIMATAADLIVVFLALELLSIPLYVMAGFARPKLASEESAMKYFLLGAFSSAFLVYGIALTYGATQSTALVNVVAALSGDVLSSPLLLAGMGLILVGLGFKVAAVPFHMWTPDVYHGAPTPVTGFMSVGAKAGGFAALLRVFVTAFPPASAEWGFVVQIVAAATLILGNVVAISQSNIKRMLAYSSIAHAGYVLMAVAASSIEPVAALGVSSALFYLLAYVFTNIGAFAVVIAVEKDDGSGGELDDFAGLGQARPLLAIAMAYFMISLTGVPPTGGFMGKFFVFQATLQANMVALAIIGVVTSLISAYYYLRVVIIMFMRDAEGEPALALGPALRAALVVTALGTFVLGVIPAPLFDLARQSLLTFFTG